MTQTGKRTGATITRGSGTISGRDDQALAASLANTAKRKNISRNARGRSDHVRRAGTQLARRLSAEGRFCYSDKRRPQIAPGLFSTQVLQIPRLRVPSSIVLTTEGAGLCEVSWLRLHSISCKTNAARRLRMFHCSLLSRGRRHGHVRGVAARPGRCRLTNVGRYAR